MEVSTTRVAVVRVERRGRRKKRDGRCICFFCLILGAVEGFGSGE